MKKIFALLTFLILVGIFIPAVSAETLYDETLQVYEFTGGQSSFSDTAGPRPYDMQLNFLVFRDIQKCDDISYIVIESPYKYYPVGDAIVKVTDWCTLTPGNHELTYTLGSHTGTGRMNVYKSKNIFGQITNTRVTLYFDDWDTGTLLGQQTVYFTPSMGSVEYGNSETQDEIGNSPVLISKNFYRFPYKITASCGDYFLNNLKIDKIDDGNSIRLIVNRQQGAKSFASNVSVYDGESNLIFNDASAVNLEEVFLSQSVSSVVLQGGGRTWNYPVVTSSPSTSTLTTVYIRNSQTGVLLANAQIVISASVNGTLHEVVNKTVPSGIYSIELQPTGGGMPNPDFYRLIVTAEGYNSIMPYIDFEVDRATTIYAYLDPIAGGPVNENKTFIDFFVRDMSSNPISGATVKFGKYTLITNSAGYTIFEVDKNNNYTWTVSKSGYGALTGNAVIGDAPRHTINTVLAPAVTPPTQTPIPTGTAIGPKPTMTAPTGEPTSNLLEWFAAHFGMILGGGAEIGKIFMWLCFAVPVGVYVGKEAKAGAAGFMVGAGIVTLFFVLIGWVPIWLLVLLALIIGLLYAKVFNNSDNGGGR